MKPEEVTDAINEDVCHSVGMYAWDGVCQKEIIAAAFNAVVSDAEPITAEWLLANGYFYHEHGVSAFCGCYMLGGHYGLYIEIREEAIVYIHGSRTDTKTIGQLRALHAGLGIGEVGNG